MRSQPIREGDGRNSITGELDAARRQLADVSVEFDAIEQNLKKALKLAKDCHAAYQEADDNTRRLFNQAFFERLYVHIADAVTNDLAEPFGLLLDPSLPDQLSHARSTGKPAQSNRSTDRPGRSRNGNDLEKTEVEGSNIDTLADLLGELSNLRPQVRQLFKSNSSS